MVHGMASVTTTMVCRNSCRPSWLQATLTGHFSTFTSFLSLPVDMRYDSFGSLFRVCSVFCILPELCRFLFLHLFLVFQLIFGVWMFVSFRIRAEVSNDVR